MKLEKLFLGLGGTISGLAAHTCWRKGISVVLWTWCLWSDMEWKWWCVMHWETGKEPCSSSLAYGNSNCQLMPRADWCHRCWVHEHPANAVTVIESRKDPADIWFLCLWTFFSRVFQVFDTVCYSYVGHFLVHDYEKIAGLRLLRSQVFRYMSAFQMEFVEIVFLLPFNHD